MLENNQDNPKIETLDAMSQPIESLDINNNDNNGFVVKKKKSNSKILIVIGIIVVLLVGLGIHYLITINNPKTIFIKASNSIFGSLENVINESVNLAEQSYLYEGNVKISTNIEEYNFLNNETFNYSLGLDIKNKKAEAGFELIENSNKLISVNADVKENNLYVDLNEIFEKMILFDDKTIKENIGMSISDLFTQIEDIYKEENIEDIKYIVSSFKKITNDALENINYEKTNVKLNINEKNVSTNKMSLTFNKENMQILARTYIEGILNDSKLVDKLCSLTDYEKTEFIEMLNEYKGQIDTFEEPSSKLQISVYTEGILGNVVKFSMEEDSREELYYINYKDYIVFAADNMIVEINGSDLTIKELDELIVTGTVNALEENNIDIYFNSADNELFKGNIIYTNNNSNIDFKFNIEVNDEEKVVINLSSNTNNISDTETEVKIVAGIEFGSQKLEISNTTKMSIGAEIATNDISNTINYNSLTETDMNTINSNLEARLKGTKYGELIGVNNKSKFITDANYAIDAAEQAMNSIALGSLSSNYTIENATTYCFTLQNLEAADFIDGYDEYEGTITVTKVGSDYSYRIEMHNDEYYVRIKDVVYEDNIYETKYMPSTIKTKCTNSASL